MLRSYLKSNLKQKGLGYDSSGRAQDLEFKLQCHYKQKQRKKKQSFQFLVFFFKSQDSELLIGKTHLDCLSTYYPGLLTSPCDYLCLSGLCVWDHRGCLVGYHSVFCEGLRIAVLGVKDTVLEHLWGGIKDR
jgi:hypothetical protein